jgi:hypothetical protein
VFLKFEALAGFERIGREVCNGRCGLVEAGRPGTSSEGWVMQEQLLSERIQIERKQFFFDLKENPQGRFLKITEDVGGRRNTIIVPSTGLQEFRDLVDQVIEADKSAGAIPAPE